MAWFGGGTVGNSTRDPNVKLGNPDRTGNIDGYDAGGSTGAGRRNVNNAPVIGTAITRAEYAKRQKDALAPPPSALEGASIATGGAKSAAERQRKRAAAGSATIAAGSLGAVAPGASYAPKSLIGGY